MNTKPPLQTSLILALIAATLIGIILQMRAANNREVTALNQRLAQVEEQLSALRLRLDPASNLSSNSPVTRRYTLPKGSPYLATPIEGPKHSGKIWGEGEVNGWKYYDIPLLGR